MIMSDSRGTTEVEKAYQDTIEDIDLESFMSVKRTGGGTSLARYKEDLLLAAREKSRI